MNICHVNLASGFSGGEQQSLLLIKQQILEGYTITVVARHDTPFASEIKKLDCKLVEAKHFVTQHLKSITVNIDLMHAHEGRAIYWAFIQSKLFNIPYIITRRIDNTLKNKLHSKLAYKTASALIGISNDVVNKIKLIHPESKVFKIPDSPIDYPKNQSEVTKIKDQFNGNFLVIQASNLISHKGHKTTLKAAEIFLKDKNENVHFAILGDGILRNELEEIKQLKQLTNVTFMGKQNTMGNWFEAADLLIHPSYSEGLGSVILEAMQANCPVIGTNVGGIPDIIKDQCSGQLIEAQNEQQLSDAIINIKNNDSLRENLIAGARKGLTEFNIVKTSQQYLKVYKNIVG